MIVNRFISRCLALRVPTSSRLSTLCRRTFMISSSSSSSPSSSASISSSYHLTSLSKIGLGVAIASGALLSEYAYARSKSSIDSNVLCASIRRGRLKSVRNMLQDAEDNTEISNGGKEAANTRHPLGWTPLQCAVVSGDAAMVRLLIEFNADVDACDEYDPRPPRRSSGLSTSASSSSSYRAIIERIERRHTEFSPAVNAQSAVPGFTALHYAALLNLVDIAQLLLDAGADPTLQDGDSLTAIGYAMEDGDTRMRNLLETAAENYELLYEAKERERRRQFPLEARLHSVVVGQESAIHAVASAVRRRQNGWHDERHPLVFLFVGPSGVGKTEVAKRVAEYLHEGNQDAFIRVDLSEFQSKHEAAKFIGAPPGYVGHDDGGQLTERLKKIPNAVCLLDEVDKAHPDVLTCLLQLFDEGRLTDGKGETINCPDAIFIMTSNLGSEEIAVSNVRDIYEHSTNTEHENGGDQSDNETSTPSHSTTKILTSPKREFYDRILHPILKEAFKRDEFIGRINEILAFLPFTQNDLHLLVEMELKKWNDKARERHSISIVWDDGVVNKLSEGYNIHYGARSIQHHVEKQIVNVIATKHERGELQRGGEVAITLEDGKDGKVVRVVIRKRGDESDYGGIGSTIKRLFS